MSYTPILSTLYPWVMLSEVDLESCGKAISVDQLIADASLTRWRVVVVPAERMDGSKLHLVFVWDPLCLQERPALGVLRPSAFGDLEPGRWIFQGATHPDPEDHGETAVLYPCSEVGANISSEQPIRWKLSPEFEAPWWCSLVDSNTEGSNSGQIYSKGKGFKDVIALGATGTYELSVRATAMAPAGSVGDSWLTLQSVSAADSNGVASATVLRKDGFCLAVGGGYAFPLRADFRPARFSQTAMLRLVYHGQGCGSGTLQTFASLGSADAITRPWLNHSLTIRKLT